MGERATRHGVFLFVQLSLCPAPETDAPRGFPSPGARPNAANRSGPSSTGAARPSQTLKLRPPLPDANPVPKPTSPMHLPPHAFPPPNCVMAPSRSPCPAPVPDRGRRSLFHRPNLRNRTTCHGKPSPPLLFRCRPRCRELVRDSNCRTGRRSRTPRHDRLALDERYGVCGCATTRDHVRAPAPHRELPTPSLRRRQRDRIRCGLPAGHSRRPRSTLPRRSRRRPRRCPRRAALDPSRSRSQARPRQGSHSLSLVRLSRRPHKKIVVATVRSDSLPCARTAPVHPSRAGRYPATEPVAAVSMPATAATPMRRAGRHPVGEPSAAALAVQRPAAVSLPASDPHGVLLVRSMTNTCPRLSLLMLPCPSASP